MHLVLDVHTHSPPLLRPSLTVLASSYSVAPPPSKVARRLQTPASVIFINLLHHCCLFGVSELTVFIFCCFCDFRVSWCDKYCSFVWCYNQEMDQVIVGFCLLLCWSMLIWLDVECWVWFFFSEFDRLVNRLRLGLLMLLLLLEPWLFFR